MIPYNYNEQGWVGLGHVEFGLLHIVHSTYLSFSKQNMLQLGQVPSN